MGLSGGSTRGGFLMVKEYRGGASNAGNTFKSSGYSPGQVDLL